MRKIFLGLFIILFCFAVGISQEEKKVTVGEAIETWTRADFEKLSKELLVNVILQFQEMCQIHSKIIKEQDEQIAEYKVIEAYKTRESNMLISIITKLLESSIANKPEQTSYEKVQNSWLNFHLMNLSSDIAMLNSTLRSPYYSWSYLGYPTPKNSWEWIALFELMKRR